MTRHAFTTIYALNWMASLNHGKGPSLDPQDKRLAVEVEDHPLDYGDFEGTIPKGEYGGGTVMLWDRGYWEPHGDKSPEQALTKGDFKFTLEGDRLHGSFVLVRMRNDRDGGKRTNWLLIKHHDDHSVEEDGAPSWKATSSGPGPPSTGPYQQKVPERRRTSSDP